MIQALLLRYWKELAALALLSFAVWRGYDWAYDNGAAKVQAKWDAQRLADARAENEALTKAIAQRNAARSALDELAKHPPKVVTVVRANPSGCNLPAPVADAIRVQVDAVNEAIRKGRVPGADSTP